MYANSPDHFYLSIIGLETGGGEPGPDRKQGEPRRIYQQQLVT